MPWTLETLGTLGHERRIHIHQNYREFLEWINLLESIRPERGLDIGTYRFGTARLTLDAIPTIRQLVTVDLVDRLSEEGNRDMVAGYHGRLQFVHGDSKSFQTRDRILELFQGQPLDFLFIDGDHSLLGVSADFWAYGPLVRPGGLIGFHDTMSTELMGQDSTRGVQQLWDWLTASAPGRCWQIPLEYGIGVLRR